ncbi:hypothetical protein MRX96_022787 [Rhipicephalus microplus]
MDSISGFGECHKVRSTAMSISVAYTRVVCLFLVVQEAHVPNTRCCLAGIEPSNCSACDAAAQSSEAFSRGMIRADSRLPRIRGRFVGSAVRRPRQYRVRFREECTYVL